MPIYLKKFPLSLQQKVLWELNELYPDDRPYTVNIAWKVQSPIDIPAFKKSVGQLVGRHPALRTTIAREGDAVLQRIHQESPDCFFAVHVKNTPKQSLDYSLEKEKQQPINMEHGPLTRVVLFLQNNQPTLLLVQLHHIVTDGISVAIMIKELGMLYERNRGGKSLTLSLPEHDYSDFVLEQRNWIRNRGKEFTDFWDRHLKTMLPVLELPADNPGFQGTPSFDTGNHLIPINSKLRERLADLGVKAKVWPLTVWFSAWLIFLQRLTGEAQVFSNIASTGRPESFGKVVGYFANMIPVSAHIAPDKNFQTILTQTSEKLSYALKYNKHTFPRMADYMGRGAGQTRFSWENFNRFGMLYKNKGQKSLVIYSGDTKEIWNIGSIRGEKILFEERDGYDLHIKIIPTPSQFYCLFSYSTSRFTAKTIALWAKQFTELLEEIAA